MIFYFACAAELHTLQTGKHIVGYDQLYAQHIAGLKTAGAIGEIDDFRGSIFD